MTSNSNWWPEAEFARPDPPRPTPGHWDLVSARSSVVARFAGRARRAQTVVLADVAGSSEIVSPGRLSTCVVAVGFPPSESLRRRARECLPAGRRGGAPMAVYRGRRLSITPGGELRVDGMLTIGPVTDRLCWSVSRHVLSVGADGTERLVFTAESSFDRRTFGLGSAPRGTGKTVRLLIRGEFALVPASRSA